MKFITLITLFFVLGSCQDKVSEPTVEYVDRRAACPDVDPEAEVSEFAFEGIQNISDINRTFAKVTWKKNNNFTSFNIINKTKANRVVLASVDGNESEYLLKGLAPDTEYTLMVRGLDKRGFLEVNKSSITFRTKPWPNFSNLKSLRFKGAQAVTLGKSKSFDLNAPFSISTWFKTDIVAQSESRLFTFHQKSKASSALSVGFFNNLLKLYYQNDDNDLRVFDYELPYADSKWTQILLSYDSSFIRMYVNGQLAFKIKDKLKGKTGTHQAHIGSYTGIQKGFFGTIDEFSFFQAAMTDIPALELYNQGSSFDLRDHSLGKDLIHWYRFGDHSGDSESRIEDIMGNANGTPFNVNSADFSNDSP